MHDVLRAEEALYMETLRGYNHEYGGIRDVLGLFQRSYFIYSRMAVCR